MIYFYDLWFLLCILITFQFSPRHSIIALSNVTHRVVLKTNEWQNPSWLMPLILVCLSSISTLWNPLTQRVHTSHWPKEVKQVQTQRRLSVWARGCWLLPQVSQRLYGLCLCLRWAVVHLVHLLSPSTTKNARQKNTVREREWQRERERERDCLLPDLINTLWGKSLPQFLSQALEWLQRRQWNYSLLRSKKTNCSLFWNILHLYTCGPGTVCGKDQLASLYQLCSPGKPAN